MKEVYTKLAWITKYLFNENKKALPSVILLFGLVFFSAGQQLSPVEPRLNQLTQAYGFILGQQASLEHIENQHPELAREAKAAWYAFGSSALGVSAKGLEDELSKIFTNQWPEVKRQTKSEIQKMVSTQNITREEALAFFAEVEARSRGELPDSILSVLLATHPRFRANPGLELTQGWKQTFQTRDHPKAKGLDFSISFPASWTRREGFRPNIVQVFHSGAGHGPIMCNLIVKEMPFEDGSKPTESELEAFFHPDNMKKMISDEGSFVEADSIVLEGVPGGMLVFDATMQRLDFSETVRTVQFMIIKGEAMIFIQFIFSKNSESSETLDDIQKKYFSTFRGIANTFVFNQKY